MARRSPCRRRHAWKATCSHRGHRPQLHPPPPGRHGQAWPMPSYSRTSTAVSGARRRRHASVRRARVPAPAQYERPFFYELAALDRRRRALAARIAAGTSVPARPTDARRAARSNAVRCSASLARARGVADVWCRSNSAARSSVAARAAAAATRQRQTPPGSMLGAASRRCRARVNAIDAATQPGQRAGSRFVELLSPVVGLSKSPRIASVVC